MSLAITGLGQPQFVLPQTCTALTCDGAHAGNQQSCQLESTCSGSLCMCPACARLHLPTSHVPNVRLQMNSAETLFRDYQKLTLQESPGSVPAGVKGGGRSEAGSRRGESAKKWGRAGRDIFVYLT